MTLLQPESEQATAVTSATECAAPASLQGT